MTFLCIDPINFRVYDYTIKGTQNRLFWLLSTILPAFAAEGRAGARPSGPT